MRDVLGWRRKFGVIGPSTNTVVQPDFEMMRPAGVTNHYSRIFTPNAQAISNESFMAGINVIGNNVIDAVRSVMTCSPDYLVMGMSSVTFNGGAAGADAFQAKIEREAGVSISIGSHSSTAALKAYGGVKRAMRRREFITLIGGAVTWPLAARAERPPFLVGMIGNSPNWNHFRDGMRDLGYTEGQNVKYELRTDEIEPARLAEAAKELASTPVDVIAAFGSLATQAARAATQTIPIVMVAVGDPVRAGMVASLAHPGRNVTGTSILGPDLAPKRLQLLKQVIPSLVRVALLFNPNNASNIIFRDESENATRDLGMSLVQVEASTVPDLDTNLRGILSQRPDALMATADPFLNLQIRKIIDFLESNRIPGIFLVREYVLAGGLMFYGASFSDLFRRSATYVHKILQGTKPSDLPVEQPTKFELVLNLKTAKTLGLTFPQALLATADEVIE